MSNFKLGLISELLTLIRNHFQVEGQPPPPCPGSLVALFSLFACLNRLKAATEFSPAENDNLDDVWRSEADSRIRMAADAIRQHFKPFSSGKGCRWEDLAPIDSQIIGAIEWASSQYETDGEDPPAGVEISHWPSKTQAAKEMEISPRELTKWITAGEVKAYKFGNEHKIDMRSLEIAHAKYYPNL